MSEKRLFAVGALMFWGWQAQVLYIAIIPAGILVFSAFAKFKFEMGSDDFNKFIDISTILLAATVIFALSDDMQGAFQMILKWMPLIAFPVMAAQSFSTRDMIPVRSFFVALRKSRHHFGDGGRSVDVTYGYALLCILPSGVTENHGAGTFFGAVVLFSVWALWHVRSRRVPVLTWILCMVCVVAIGLAGQKAIYKIGTRISRWMFMAYAGRYLSDPFKSQTAIGDIGRLKLSGKIVLRLAPESLSQGRTWLIRNGSYQNFLGTSWFSRNSFSSMSPLKKEDFWQINPDNPVHRKMTLYQQTPRKKAVLALPGGLIRLYGLAEKELEINAEQIVRIKDAPSLIKTSVTYTDGLSYDAPPDIRDFKTPKKEEAVLLKMMDEMGLEGLSPSQAVERVRTYFAHDFTYSLELKGRGRAGTPLENFLFNTRAGHCELFATATVLILRKAGIPARYSTGFIAHEYSNLEKQIVVRQRDAHAWATAFISGKWQDIDTTPASFVAADSQLVETHKLFDLVSYLLFRVKKFKIEVLENLFGRYGLWLILPLGLMLFFRIKRTGAARRIKKGKKRRDTDGNKIGQVWFNHIEKKLSQKGVVRFPHETYPAWIRRIAARLKTEEIKADLAALAELHNRLRFSKNGLSSRQKVTIKKLYDKLINMELVAES